MSQSKIQSMLNVLFSTFPIYVYIKLLFYITFWQLSYIGKLTNRFHFQTNTHFHNIIWMDGWVRVLRPFNSISVISRRWKGEHERLCAMKRRLGSGIISPPADSNPRPRDPKSGALTARPRGRFNIIWVYTARFTKTCLSKNLDHCGKMSHPMTKPTKWHVRPSKTEISLGIRTVW